MSENPYAPSDRSNNDARKEDQPEGWLVRLVYGCLALVFIAFMATFRGQPTSVLYWAVEAAFFCLAFSAGFVAVTSRFFSLRRLFRRPT